MGYWESIMKEESLTSILDNLEKQKSEKQNDIL